MTWQGHKGRVGLSDERPNPIRQDRSNRDEVSEWRPATPRQPHRDHVTWIRGDLRIQRDQVGSVDYLRIQQDPYFPVSGTKDTNSI